MTTIKTPQTVSHSKPGNNQKGGGFVAFLVILSWLAIGAVFYGVKSGMLQSSEVSPAINEKLLSLENNVSSLDARLKIIEKRLADASSILNPGASEVKPNPAKPEEAKPSSSAAPVTAPSAKVEEGQKPDSAADAAKTGAEPLMTEPKAEEKASPAKPQSKNEDKTRSADRSSVSEKKSRI